MAQAMTKTRHPLEPLSVDELTEAVAILRAGVPGGVWDERRFRFVEVALREPPKADVLAAEASGNGHDLPREARAVLIDRAERGTVEAIVSLTEGQVVDWRLIESGQATLTLEEILDCEQVVRQDPDFQAAMHRRGITDMDLVWVDPWPFGVYEDEADLEGRRLTRGIVWVRSSPDDDNGYAHPVENVIVIFDLHEMAVVRIEDHGVVPVPARNANYGLDDVGPRASGSQAARDQPAGGPELHRRWRSRALAEVAVPGWVYPPRRSRLAHRRLGGERSPAAHPASRGDVGHGRAVW